MVTGLTWTRFSGLGEECRARNTRMAGNRRYNGRGSSLIKCLPQLGWCHWRVTTCSSFVPRHVAVRFNEIGKTETGPRRVRAGNEKQAYSISGGQFRIRPILADG
jgi:hypothetical protein